MDRAVILYDDDCGFCRWSLSKILVWIAAAVCGRSRCRIPRPTAF